MSRRISRLRTEPPDRTPVLVVGALIGGLIAGLVAVPRLFPAVDARVEQYVLLASALYSQGETPALLRDRLVSVGINQPASLVLDMAQRYSTSRDKKQEHRADGLEAFGKVLLNPAALPATVAAPISPSAEGALAAGQPILPPLTTPLPEATATAHGLSGQPNVAVPVGTAAVTPTLASVPISAAAATAATPRRGRISPADGGSARLRKGPSTDETLSLIPNGAEIEILETVRGQSIEGETRWYLVRYGNLQGYLWSRLVLVVD